MAETRETQVIEDVINGDEISNPRTTEEAILAKIIAGEEVDINARTRYQAYLKELSSISGGNPNSVEEVTGTVQHPWGDKNPAILFYEAKTDKITMSMEIDGTPLGLPTFFVFFNSHGGKDDYFEVIGGYGLGTEAWYAGVIAYADSGLLTAIYILQNSTVTNLMNYASLLTSTLIIIHHPLPEDNT